MKRSAKKFSVTELAAVGFIVFTVTQPVLAGNKTSVSTTGNGWVYSDLVYGTKVISQKGSTTESIAKPASSVNYGAVPYTPPPTATKDLPNNPIASDLPSGAKTAGATTFFSQAITKYFTGGYKGVATTGVAYPATADNPELQAELIKRGFVLQGAKCGADYDIASGGEEEDGKKFLVVYGTATEGTAAWFQGFGGGKKLYDVLITGPFDFGSETDDCKALRIPFVYGGRIDDVTFLADYVALTDTDLAFVNLNPVTVECPGTVQAPAGIGTTGGCGPTKLIYSPALGTELPSGQTTTVTVTAVDEKLNQIVGSYDITVVDTTRPVLTGQGGNRAIECSDLIDPLTLFTAPTGTDSCDSNPKITFQDARTELCPGSYSITRTWTATDSSDHDSLPVSQTISVLDRTAPSLVGVPENLNIVVSCDSVPSVANVTATDNCDPDPKVTPVTTTNKGSDPSMSDYYNYTITRTWTAMDACGNTSSKKQTITVQDKTAPAAQPLPPVTLQCLTSSALTPPTAEDVCAGTVTGTTSAQDLSQPGTYTVTWRFTDPSGNYTERDQLITTVVSFKGFFAPLNGVDTAEIPCPPSLKTIKLGSKIPIKFSTSCDGKAFSFGVPTFEITKCSDSEFKLTGETQFVAGEWHANWDSGQVNAGAGVYVIRVELQDFTSRHATITLK